MAPPNNPKNTNACGDMGPAPGQPPTPDSPSDEKDECKKKPEMECTCIAPGGASRPCAPNTQICIPNAAGGGDTQIRATCHPKPNVNNDGSKVFITSPKSGATFPANKQVWFAAKACPEDKANEIQWAWEPVADVSPTTPNTDGPSIGLKWTK